MNIVEVEALLFRIRVVYPSAARSEIESKALVVEWLDSAVVEIDVDEANAALREWKDTQDWAPSPHQFIALCRDRRRRAANRLALEVTTGDVEIPDDPEERARIVEESRRIREAAAAVLKTVPDEELPNVRHQSGALVYDGGS